MLADLSAQPADALLALIKLHADDLRPDKIDLGVGVYRNESGNTAACELVRRAPARPRRQSRDHLGRCDLAVRVFLGAAMYHDIAFFNGLDRDRG